MSDRFASLFFDPNAASCHAAKYAGHRERLVEIPVDHNRDRVGARLLSLVDVRREFSQIEVKAAERTVPTESRLKTLLEALVLVWSGPVGVEELIVQAFLRPGRDGAVDKRDLDEEIDAVVQGVDGERGRSEFEDREFRLERESVRHLEASGAGCADGRRQGEGQLPSESDFIISKSNRSALEIPLHPSHTRGGRITVFETKTQSRESKREKIRVEVFFFCFGSPAASPLPAARTHD
jgi:hypothetical protein